MNKNQGVWLGLSMISIIGHAMEVASPMEHLKRSDEIAIWEPDEEKTQMSQKRLTYQTLADQDLSDAGIHAQLRMAIIWHNGLFGYKKNKYNAIPYWTALSNQAGIPWLRVLGLEMLGVYHQEGWQSVGGSEVQPNLSMAKEYFSRSIDAYKAEDKECKKDTETVPRLRAQLQAVIRALTNK